MDIYNLTSEEVNRLIKSLKHLKAGVLFDSPLVGMIKDDAPLTDYTNQIEYKFHRYRHPIDTNRFSMHIRFMDSDEHLIRLDINNGRHRNPDGTIIEQNHLHIYNSGLDRKDAYAIPLPSEIKYIETIFDAMINILMLKIVRGDRNDHSDRIIKSVP